MFRTVFTIAKQVTEAGLQLLYPPTCAFCDCDLEAFADGFCDVCRSLIDTPMGPICRRCAAPVSSLMVDQPDCMLCRGATLHFDSVTAVGVYRETLREVVLRLKQAGQEALSRSMAEVVHHRIAASGVLEGMYLVSPIPMHWRRRMVRGFNPASLLAEYIARQTGFRLIDNMLQARRFTEKQAMLPPSRRVANVRGAYGVRLPEAVAGARILLVDDIMTTGATASEAAKILKKAGADQVHLAVVARGVGLNQ